LMGHTLDHFREWLTVIQQQANSCNKKVEDFNSQIFAEITKRQLLEDRLKESDTRFATFMDHVPGIVTIQDADGRCQFANESWETIWGRHPNDWVGRSVGEILPPDLAERVLELDRKVLANGQPLETVETYEQEGVKHFWLVKRFPIPGPGGLATMVGAVGIDITNWRQTEEAAKEYSLHHSPGKPRRPL
jgi:PAS domain S-box-containing protein